MEPWERAFEAWYHKTQPPYQGYEFFKEAWLACWAFCIVMCQEDFNAAMKIMIHGEDNELR